MQFTIRPAQPVDVPQLLAMIRALAEYERLTQLVTADEGALAAALFGPQPAAEALLAWENAEKRSALGFALFYPTFSTFLARRGVWLEDVFVYPEYRGKGIGRRLLSEVGVIARQRGAGRLEWAVLDWNRPAISFYEGLGATVMPDWRIARVTGSTLASFGVDGDR